MEAEKNIIRVSDEFISIYSKFNVISQINEIKKLSRKERLLLMALSVDSFSEDNAIAIENYREFKEDLKLIFELQNDKKVEDKDLKDLSEMTGDKYIDTSKIRNSKNESLPDPLSDDEATNLRREIGINNIIKK